MKAETLNTPLNPPSEGGQTPKVTWLMRWMFITRYWYLTQKVRLMAIRNVLKYKKFAGIGLPNPNLPDGTYSKEEMKRMMQPRNANNIQGMTVFLVPNDALGIDRAINRLGAMKRGLHNQEKKNLVSQKKSKKKYKKKL